MKILVAVKRVIDYNVQIRVKEDGNGSKIGFLITSISGLISFNKLLSKNGYLGLDGVYITGLMLFSKR